MSSLEAKYLRHRPMHEDSQLSLINPLTDLPKAPVEAETESSETSEAARQERIRDAIASRVNYTKGKSLGGNLKDGSLSKRWEKRRPTYQG